MVLRLFSLTMAIVPLAFLCASAAQAQDSGLECASKTIIVAQSPAEVAVTVNPIFVGPACTDAPGQTMHLASVSTPATLVEVKPPIPGAKPDIEAMVNDDIVDGGSTSFNFTVTDDAGASTTATLTVVHDSQPQS